jgi:hypothetical protein
MSCEIMRTYLIQNQQGTSTATWLASASTELTSYLFQQRIYCEEEVLEAL